MAGRLTYGWVIVVTLGITETVSYGVLGYAFGVLLVPMQQQTGWSRTAITGALSLALLVSGVAALRVGRLLDAHSPRLLMTGGSVLAAVLVVAWSQVRTLVELYVVFAGLGVAMALVLYEPAFTVIAKWFPVRRNAALSTLTLLGASASIIFSPLTDALVRAHGWRGALIGLALILAAVTVPLHALVLRAAPPHIRDPGVVVEALGRREILGRRAFRLIATAFSLGTFVTVAVSVHIVSLLIHEGRTPRFAAFAAGLLGLSQIPGRLLFVLTHRVLGIVRNAGLVFAVGASALVLLALSHTTTAILAFVVAFGISAGMTTLLRATIVADLYGIERFGSISGVVSLFALSGRAAAPLGAALIVLAPGGYTTLLVLLAGVAAICAWLLASGARSSLA